MRKKSTSSIKVFVSDIQPILPAVAGGRLRLAGIWGNLSSGFEMKYVGTFDRVGQPKRIEQLGKNAIEILIPCSSEHFSRMEYDNAYLPDLTLFDIAFHRYGHLSEEYITESIKHLENADIVVFSHPWSYPILKKYLKLERQYLIYDSQNVESFLRAENLLKPQYGKDGLELLEEILHIENELSNDADLILTCSERDSKQFSFLYGIDQGKLSIAPNGVFVDSELPRVTANKKIRLKKKWKLERQYTAVFSGSNFGPNVRSLIYINQIASNCPEIDFIITGDMHTAISPRNLSENVHLVGLLGQRKLSEVYRMADVGLNPMVSGSGSNVKVFTYMGAGIPVLSTPLGARGLDVAKNGLYEGEEALVIANLEDFQVQLKLLLADNERRDKIVGQAYKMILLNYNWKEISRQVCQTMKLKFQL